MSSRIQIKETTQGTLITLRWFSPKRFWFWSSLNLIWNGILLAALVIGGPQIASDVVTNPVLWMFLFFPLLGFVMFTYWLMLVVNKAYLEVNTDKIKISHKPIPFWGKAEINVSEIERFFIRRYESFRRNRKPVWAWELVVRLQNKNMRQVATGLDSPDEAKIIESALQSTLGIKDPRSDGQTRSKLFYERQP